MSLTILYRDPHRPHEGGITMIVGQAKVAAILVDLEKRGFLVDKITLRHLPKHKGQPYNNRSGGAGGLFHRRQPRCSRESSLDCLSSFRTYRLSLAVLYAVKC